MHTETHEQRYLTALQLAKYMGVHPNTVVNWVKAGAPYTPIGTADKRFRPEEITDWLKSRYGQKTTTPEKSA